METTGYRFIQLGSDSDFGSGFDPAKLNAEIDAYEKENKYTLGPNLTGEPHENWKEDYTPKYEEI